MGNFIAGVVLGIVIGGTAVFYFANAVIDELTDKRNRP